MFRAIFWIGLIFLLAPRAPDPDLPHHGLKLSLPSFEMIRATAHIPTPTCTGCSPTRSLADVKAEIDASITARGKDFYAF